MRFDHTPFALLASSTFILFLAIPVQGQTTLGFRGGVSVSSLEADLGETLDDSNRTGFDGGIFLDLGGDSPLGFQIAAQYSQRGTELDLGETVEELTLNYLEIPVVAKLGVPLGIAKPSLLGGVAVGFNTSCEGGIGAGADCDEQVTSTNYAGILGADVVINPGGVSLWVDGRFHFGLNDISDAVDIDELSTRAWTLQAGVGFPVGG